VTLDSEIKEGQQYYVYQDSIEVRGGTGSNTWSIIDGDLPAGYNIDNNGVIYGATSDTGLFTFTVLVDDNGSNYSDQGEFTIYVAPTAVIPGDVDTSGSVNVADLTFIVAYLFQGGSSPLVLNTADVDGSCEINVEDLTYMVEYLFLNGSDLVMGCVE